MTKTRTARTFETRYEYLTDWEGLCWAVVMTVPWQNDSLIRVDDHIVIARFMWEKDADNFTYVAPMIWDDLGH